MYPGLFRIYELSVGGISENKQRRLFFKKIKNNLWFLASEAMEATYFLVKGFFTLFQVLLMQTTTAQ